MEAQQLWEKACVLMRAEMTQVTFNTWIASALKPLAVRGDSFYIEAVTDFYYQFVVNRYSGLIANTLTQTAGRTMKAEILTPAQAEEFRSGASPARTPGASFLNPRYTFETFVVGANNRFAHAACLVVAESPGDTYNPLFIYGGVGLGKTHLLHAIGHYILSQNPAARIKYITTEAFTNEMIAAIQSRTMSEFKDKYRNNVDVLMVDDIQFLAGRDATQEEFFHTFNSLRETGKQIVISSDKPPKEIPKLEERLRSRFEWGLIADISRPDEETRYEILRRKAEGEALEVPPDVLHMIAERIQSNIRELEGAMTRLIAYASLTGRPITKELAETALRETFAASEHRRITCEDVIRSVSEYYNVKTEELKGPKRSRDIAVPRQLAMYLSRALVDVSLEMIGNAFNRDHTTVMHACQKMETELKTSSNLAAAAGDIRKRLTENG